ncbi:(S)-N-methylcoclaurine 3'-hydroxylase isozyme 2 [Morus notabilis]|uniref:(S)-N-methylcoclaurine 3'-hydroxylase isozyme 2 n=1 Tax=Morus notabilis TaxID=981085 RepID=W9SZ96_9ROSA|nr:(S)-N-methylcoclaurine 3'-hydroxylase isozyme 1 [Morus notabilis]EXC34117.1 (S)-N-methylcoclaurine 3'-hydroxylase isozyme 2 [Morus notabilis]
MAESIVMEIPKPFLLLLLLLPVLYFILKNLKHSKSPPLPPGPYPWPILGNLLQVLNNPLETLTKLGQTYGPVFTIKLGCQRVVGVSSPAAAIQILKTEDRLLAGRTVPHVLPAQNPELNSQYIGWAAEYAESWKDLRTVCRTHIFSSKAIESQARLREEKAMKMVTYIASMEGKPVKIVSVTFAAVFDMLSQIFLSVDLINFEQEVVDGWLNRLFRDLVEMAVMPNISDFYPILSRFDIQGLRKKIVKIHEKICSKWEGIIEERREKKRGDHADYNSEQQDLLDALISNGSFSNAQIIVLLRELLLAGSDSSAATIEWIMVELIRSPRCMKIVQEELAREISQGMVTESDLPKFPYLQACFKETLRLHPPAPLLIPRRALESCQVMNYTIPKDSKVQVNVWAIGRDPEYWKDPLVFKPERFLDSSLEFKGNDFEYLPFGSGRRMCPGMPMASKQVPLVLASLLHFFDWSLPYEQNPENLSMRAKYGLTLVKEEPLILIPKIKSILPHANEQ